MNLLPARFAGPAWHREGMVVLNENSIGRLAAKRAETEAAKRGESSSLLTVAALSLWCSATKWTPSALCLLLLFWAFS